MKLTTRGSMRLEKPIREVSLHVVIRALRVSVCIAHEVNAAIKVGLIILIGNVDIIAGDTIGCIAL